MKTVSLSVRVSDDDAAFLAGLKVDGAITPSEKLRAVLSQARRREEGMGSYQDGLDLFTEMLAPAAKLLREYELENNARSELLHLLLQWLPEAMSFISSALITSDEQKENDSWLDVEAGMADRVMRLLEATLRLAVTDECVGYDPKVIAKRLKLIMKLTSVISNTQKKEKK